MPDWLIQPQKNKSSRATQLQQIFCRICSRVAWRSKNLMAQLIFHQHPSRDPSRSETPRLATISNMMPRRPISFCLLALQTPLLCLKSKCRAGGIQRPILMIARLMTSAKISLGPPPCSLIRHWISLTRGRRLQRKSTTLKHLPKRQMAVRAV